MNGAIDAPTTVAEVEARLSRATSAAFAAATASRRRDPFKVGISSLGGCSRAAAYALSRTPVSDEPGAEEGRAANLGTWQHEGLLPLLAQVLGDAAIERPVVLKAAGLEFPGHIDLDWVPVGPVDLKTVGEHRLGQVRRPGKPFYAHRVQARSYALARLQAGIPTPFLGWHYLDRATGDEHIIAEEFSNAAALDVIDRVQQLADYAEDPDSAPRDERGPGLSPVCDHCPWLRQCWGEDAYPGTAGAQANLVRTDADALAALLDYDDAAQRARQAKKDKEFAVAKLSRTRFATYPLPDRPGLGIKYTRYRGYEVLDEKAAKQRLIELGEEPPTRWREGNLSITVVKLPNSPATELKRALTEALREGEGGELG